jgi:hypothetical protein
VSGELARQPRAPPHAPPRAGHALLGAPSWDSLWGFHCLTLVFALKMGLGGLHGRRAPPGPFFFLLPRSWATGPTSRHTRFFPHSPSAAFSRPFPSTNTRHYLGFLPTWSLGPLRTEHRHPSN